MTDAERYEHERDRDRRPGGYYYNQPRAEMAVAWDDAEDETIEQIDDMAGEVVSRRVLLAVYGGLIAMIVAGVVILRWLGASI